MAKAFLGIILSIVILAGCASRYGETPQARAAYLADASDYDLCKLMILDPPSLPDDMRTEIRRQLQQRKQDCAAFATAIQQEDIRRRLQRLENSVYWNQHFWLAPTPCRYRRAYC